MNRRLVVTATTYAIGGHCRAGEGSHGTPVGPNEITAEFAALIRKGDLPRIRFHDLRHSHATQLLRQGIHPKVVSERLGHSTIGITLDVYSHVLPGMQEGAARRIDAALRAAFERIKRRNREVPP